MWYLAPFVAFRAPDWSAPLDPEAYFRKTPSRATAKGMFFTRVQRQLMSEGKADRVPEARRTYREFMDYPYVELMKLEVGACRELYPDLSLAEGLRRMGQPVFGMFAGSMIGKVIFGVVGRDPKRHLELAAKGYRHAASMGTGKAASIHSGGGTLSLRDVPNFPSTFHVGVVEGTLRDLGFDCDIEVDEWNLFDVDIRVTWSPARRPAGG